jgi:hypothetical protein
MEFSCVRFDVHTVLSVKIGVSGRDDMQFCILAQFGAQTLNCVVGCVNCIFSLIIFLAMCPHWVCLVAVLILVYCFGCVKQDGWVQNM